MDTLWRFENKWVNFYSDNLNNFAQVFVVGINLSLHASLQNSLLVCATWKNDFLPDIACDRQLQFQTLGELIGMYVR